MKLSYILKLVDGKCEIDEAEISFINDTKNAKDGEITFFNDRKYLEDLKKTKASFVLVREADKEYLPKNAKAVVVEDPYLAFALLSQEFAPKKSIKSENVIIGDNCLIADDVMFHSNIVVGNSVTIGSGTIIHPNVTIYDNTIIGKNCIIHSGTVLGSDGFGYAYTKEKKAVKIYHFGRVVLGDSVEIGANCAVDRGVFGDTFLDDGVKVDNLVHIGHNCEFGKDSIVTGQCGFAGSSKIGSKVTFGAQSGVAGHLSIGDNIMFAARSGVTKDITKSGIYAGFPAKPHKEWLKEIATISKISKKRS
jgi:UDP-3-O-[3-hydroxymyristoyl] glucosamine N-acyltransferase